MNDIFSIETGNNFHADHRFRLIWQGLRVIINYYKRRAEGVVHIKSNEKFTQRAELAIENARAAAGELGHGYVGTEHLLLGIIAEKDGLGARILRSQGLDGERLRGIIIRRSGVGSPAKPSQGLTERAKLAVERAAEEARCLQQSYIGTEHLLLGLLRQSDCGAAAVLREAGCDLNDIYTDVMAVFGNPDFRGKPQTGAARSTIRRADTRVLDQYSRDLTDLAAGGAFDPVVGRTEEIRRAIQILSRRSKNNPVLVGEPGVGKTAVAEGLAMCVAQGQAPAELKNKRIVSLDIPAMLAGTKYRGDFEKDAALERRFQPVKVGEPDREQTMEMLRSVRTPLERHHGVRLTAGAMRAAYELSVRYINDRFLPDKAIDLLDEAAAAVHVAGERITVETQDVAQVVSMWTGVPVTGLDADESLRLLTLEKQLRERIIGQDEAVSAVARAIRRGRVGLKDPGRPVGSFLFLGPTGVGKTELCRALAATVYGDEGAMIRLDMSEYMEKHSVSRLIGSPPGYVGYEDGGQLTEKVRRKPWSVVLFDEIEKAHEDVWGILLQIMDDGHLTDSAGRRIDFSNTVIVMTSNIGAKAITENRPQLGFTGGAEPDGETMRSRVMEELRATFKPEFLNRVDETIIFRRLGEEDMLEITRTMLTKVAERFSALGLELSVPQETAQWLAHEGYDERFGARPLRRTLQHSLEDTAADMLLDGRIARGDRVTAEVADGGIILVRDKET